MTAWVPLMEATAETGPMQVLPRAHRRGVMRHYGANVKAPGLTVHPDHIPSDTPEPVTVACSIGDALLFGHMMPHRSEANETDVIRWGADLRYTPPEAGDWGPGEGGFLARSAKGVAEGYPDANGGVRPSLALPAPSSCVVSPVPFCDFALAMLLAPLPFSAGADTIPRPPHVQAVRDWQDYVNMRKTHTANPNAPPGGRKHHDRRCFARPSPIHLSRLPPRAQANAIVAGRELARCCGRDVCLDGAAAAGED